MDLYQWFWCKIKWIWQIRRRSPQRWPNVQQEDIVLGFIGHLLNKILTLTKLSGRLTLMPSTQHDPFMPFRVKGRCRESVSSIVISIFTINQPEIKPVRLLYNRLYTFKLVKSKMLYFT